MCQCIMTGGSIFAFFFGNGDPTRWTVQNKALVLFLANIIFAVIFFGSIPIVNMFEDYIDKILRSEKNV